LAENRKGEGVITLPDGLQYKVLTMGTGEKPQKDQKVKVKYEGKLIDGTIFDSSYKRNPQTSEFRCDQVIKGWTEALQLMPVGSKWELYIPQDLAYGERQAGTIKPFSTLIFTVELIDIVNDEEKKADTDKTATDKKATTDKKAAGGNAAKVAAAKNVARKITKKK
jgi:FKBP-type peptidyl-prolyl cis-trans isomerase FklB